MKNSMKNGIKNGSARGGGGGPHHLEGFDVVGDQLALIVQHLLEMRHVPTRVGGVPAYIQNK